MLTTPQKPARLNFRILRYRHFRIQILAVDFRFRCHLDVLHKNGTHCRERIKKVSFHFLNLAVTNLTLLPPGIAQPQAIYILLFTHIWYLASKIPAENFKKFKYLPNFNYQRRSAFNCFHLHTTLFHCRQNVTKNGIPNYMQTSWENFLSKYPFQ